MSRKILIIEDDKAIASLLARIFEKDGHLVVLAENTDEGEYKIKMSTPDLIVLDINIPTIGGYELCASIKKRNEYKHIPIIMITGQYLNLQDKIRGFRLGANDYITKPFENTEVLARAKVWLDRSDYGKEVRNVIRFNNMVLDKEQHLVTVMGKKIDLRPKEFELLHTFMTMKDKVLNRSYLMEAVMGYESVGDERTIDEHVKNLRKKLGKCAKYIQTIRNYGYLFKTG